MSAAHNVFTPGDRIRYTRHYTGFIGHVESVEGLLFSTAYGGHGTRESWALVTPEGLIKTLAPHEAIMVARATYEDVAP